MTSIRLNHTAASSTANFQSHQRTDSFGSQLRFSLVKARTGLYEYLSVRVPEFSADGTIVTATAGETYDDDPGLGGLDAALHESSMITKVDAETYDDDPGTGALGLLNVSTRQTRQDTEGFDDDPCLSPLSAPVSLGTRATFVDAETFDDDAGNGWPGLL